MAASPGIRSLANPNSFRFHRTIMIDDPLHCGYMLTFCEAEFNTENLSFIIEVDRLRDNMLVGCIPWDKDRWREIDADFGFCGNFLRDSNPGPKQRSTDSDKQNYCVKPSLIYHEPSSSSKSNHNNWINKSIDKRKAEEDVKRIWAEYVEKDSPSQICLSSTVVERTSFRVKYFDIYGPDVFTEAIEEHMVNTVEVDTVPRFLNSEICHKMSSLLCTLYTADALEVPSPDNEILRKSTIENLENKLFTLYEILSDGILYHCFLEYLKSASSEKCLLCLQMIAVFEDEINQENDKLENSLLIEQYTWEIYRYFLTGNTDFEIRLCERDRKEIMRNLAKPVTKMFYPLRLASFDMVEAHFELFSKTEKYLKLNIVMMNAIDRENQKSRSKSLILTRKVGCLNF